MTAMKRWTDLYTAAGAAEEVLEDALLDALGFDPGNPGDWPPWLDWSFDYYDASATVAAPDDFTLPDTAPQKLAAAGIRIVWCTGRKAALWMDAGLAAIGARLRRPS